MDAQVKKTHDAFVTRGYPVVIGEYGAIDKSAHDSANNRYRADFVQTMVASAKQYGGVTIYWDNGVNGQYGFGLFNRSTYAVTQQGIIDAIMSAVGGTASPLASGATYKIRNVATGGYLDSEGSGGLTLTSASSYDDQDWVVTQQSNGAWMIHNARAGRYYLDTEPSNVVIWNDGYVGADSQWQLESTSGGFRLDNERSDRSYLYGTSAGQVRWNTGSTDSSTVWAFERQ
jgi:endoglucanase